jgi:uncharacterized repeat protein (TIGR01451 family)
VFSRFGRGSFLFNIFPALLLLVGWQSSAGAATLATDKPDYSPGQYVTFTGSGWSAGETVQIEVWESSVTPDLEVGGVTATADANGTISNSDFAVIQSYLNEGFIAYATGLVSHATATATFTDSGGAYSITFFSADPDPQKGPTYQKLPPTVLACPGTAGRYADPLLNSTRTVTTLDPSLMALGQVIPDIFQITVSTHVSTSPENGTIQFVASWDTHTTPGDNFGYDKNYMIYCAFVDTAYPGTIDANANAKVVSVTSYLTNSGLPTEAIVGVFTVSGLDSGDNVFVKVWTVLDSTIPTGANGNVQSALLSAQTVATTPDKINTGNQTTGLKNGAQSFFNANADLGITKTASPVCIGSPLTYTLTVTNNSTDTFANEVVVTDTLPTSVTFISASGTDGFGQPITGNNHSGKVDFNIGPLGPGATTTLTIHVTPNSSGSINNTAVVSSITGDPTPGNNTASISTTIYPLPTCSITGPSTVLATSTGNQYTGAAGMTSWSWSTDTPSRVSFEGGITTSQSVLIDIIGGTGLGSFWLTNTIVDSHGCTKTCATQVQITGVSDACTLSGPLTVCAGATHIEYDLTPPALPGTLTYTWSLVNSGGSAAVFNPDPNLSTQTTTAYVDTSGVGSYAVKVVVSSDSGFTAPPCEADTTVGQVTASAIPTSIACNGGHSTVTVSASGGTAPYTATGGKTFSTGGSATYDVTISGTSQTLTYTVTDANSCSTTATANVTQPTALTPSASATSIACNGGHSTVTVTASGGTAPYTATGGKSFGTGGSATYDVTVGGTSQTFTYTITDANSCTATASVNITQPSSLTPSASATSIACNGGHSTVTVTASGGTAPYTSTGGKSFGTGGSATYDVTVSGSSQTFTYTVTDANSCSATASVNITQPTALTPSASATSIACNGGHSTVTVTASGGTAPYTSTDGKSFGTGGSATYDVTVSGTSQTFTYTVTDANSCTATASVNITQPTALTPSASATSIACNGGHSTVTVTASGGTAPYTATGGQSFGAGGSATYDVTVSGTKQTFTYTVTDANSCSATATVCVTQPTALTPSASATSIACNGGHSTVTVTASGGTAPYTATGGQSFGAGGSATYDVTVSGTSQTFTYTVTDANSCSATATANVTQPTALTPSASASSIACNGGHSTVTVTASGGTAPYTADGGKSFGAGGSATYDVTINGTSQTFTYTVTDANSCSATATANVTQPTALSPSASASSIACNGGHSTVTVTASGGTAPYTATGGQSFGAGGSATYDVTVSGTKQTFTYTVTDANSCSATASVCVTQPTALTPSASATSIACNGGHSTVTVTASGGTAPYTATGGKSFGAGGSATYDVTVSGTSQTFTYTVTDANSCSATASVNITQPTALSPSASATSIACNGGHSTVTVTASGGTAPYTATGGQSFGAGGSATYDVTVSGTKQTFTYTVTDANSCSANATVCVTQPTALSPSASATSIACNGGHSTVTVTASGGTAPYTATGGQSFGAGGSATYDVTVSGTKQTFTYTVTDANSCSATATVCVTQPTPLSPSASATSIACNGGHSTVTVTASGGTAPYTATGGKSFAAGGSATYDVTISGTKQTFTYRVTDANSCSATVTACVTQPTALSPSASASSIACNGGHSTVTVTASGGTAPYTSTGGKSFDAAGSATYDVTISGTSQTFTYTVTDANSCSATVTANVTQPTALSPSASASTIACNGGHSTVTVRASGGTAPYTADGGKSFAAGGSATYDVTVSGTSQTFTYTVTDANSCSATATVSVTQPTALSPSASAPNIACNGGSTTVTVTASGGTAPYTSTGGKTFTASGSATYSVTVSGTSQTFTYTVTDAHSCSATATVNVTQPAMAVHCGTISGATDVQLGSSANTLSVMPTGGTTTPSTPYTYKWTVDNSAWTINGSTMGSSITYTAPTSISTATFKVVVTDNNGCSSTCMLTVTSLPLDFVTDSMLCTFTNPRLIFTQDPTAMPCYKVTASNPGQYYLNMTYQAPANGDGSFPSSASFNITLPYPFVTQGAQPIHGYDGVTITQSGGQICLTPGNVIFATNTQVTLTNYSQPPVVGTTTYSFQLTVPLSSKGYIYLNIHLDYGLKKVGGYTPNSNGDAVACGSSGAVTIPNNMTYPFSHSVNGGTPISASPGYQPGNDFKKNPGVGGLANHATSLNAEPGATAVLKDSGNKTVLGTSITDSDGWYMVVYKWTGKATTLYVTLTPAGGGTPITQTVTLKSNGYSENDFVLP